MTQLQLIRLILAIILARRCLVWVNGIPGLPCTTNPTTINSQQTLTSQGRNQLNSIIDCDEVSLPAGDGTQCFTGCQPGYYVTGDTDGLFTCHSGSWSGSGATCTTIPPLVQMNPLLETGLSIQHELVPGSIVAMVTDQVNGRMFVSGQNISTGNFMVAEIPLGHAADYYTSANVTFTHSWDTGSMKMKYLLVHPKNQSVYGWDGSYMGTTIYYFNPVTGIQDVYINSLQLQAMYYSSPGIASLCNTNQNLNIYSYTFDPNGILFFYSTCGQYGDTPAPLISAWLPPSYAGTVNGTVIPLNGSEVLNVGYGLNTVYQQNAELFQLQFKHGYLYAIDWEGTQFIWRTELPYSGYSSPSDFVNNRFVWMEKTTGSDACIFSFLVDDATGNLFAFYNWHYANHRILQYRMIGNTYQFRSPNDVTCFQNDTIRIIGKVSGTNGQQINLGLDATVSPVRLYHNAGGDIGYFEVELLPPVPQSTLGCFNESLPSNMPFAVTPDTSIPLPFEPLPSAHPPQPTIFQVEFTNYPVFFHARMASDNQGRLWGTHDETNIIYEYRPGTSIDGTDIQPIRNVTVIGSDTSVPFYSYVRYLTYNSVDGYVYAVDDVSEIVRFDPMDLTTNVTSMVVPSVGAYIYTISFDANNIMFVSTDTPELIAIDFSSGTPIQTKMNFQSGNRTSSIYSSGESFTNVAEFKRLQWSHGYLYGVGGPYGDYIVRTMNPYPHFTDANDFLSNPFHAILASDYYSTIGGFTIEPVTGNMFIIYEGRWGDIHTYESTVVASHQLIGNTYVSAPWSVPCQPQAMQVLGWIPDILGTMWFQGEDELALDLTTNRLYWFSYSNKVLSWFPIQLQPQLPQTELGCPAKCLTPPNPYTSLLPGSCSSQSYPAIHGTTCLDGCPSGWMQVSAGAQFRCTFGNWTGGGPYTASCLKNCPLMQPLGSSMGNCTSVVNGNNGTCTLTISFGYLLSSGSLTLTCSNGSLTPYPTLIPNPVTSCAKAPTPTGYQGLSSNGRNGSYSSLPSCDSITLPVVTGAYCMSGCQPGYYPTADTDGLFICSSGVWMGSGATCTIVPPLAQLNPVVPTGSSISHGLVPGSVIAITTDQEAGIMFASGQDISTGHYVVVEYPLGYAADYYTPLNITYTNKWDTGTELMQYLVFNQANNTLYGQSMQYPITIWHFNRTSGVQEVYVTGDHLQSLYYSSPYVASICDISQSLSLLSFTFDNHGLLYFNTECTLPFGYSSAPSISVWLPPWYTGTANGTVIPLNGTETFNAGYGLAPENWNFILLGQYLSFNHLQFKSGYLFGASSNPQSIWRTELPYTGYNNPNDLVHNRLVPIETYGYSFVVDDVTGNLLANSNLDNHRLFQYRMIGNTYQSHSPSDITCLNDTVRIVGGVHNTYLLTMGIDQTTTPARIYHNDDGNIGYFEIELLPPVPQSTEGCFSEPLPSNLPFAILPNSSLPQPSAPDYALAPLQPTTINTLFVTGVNVHTASNNQGLIWGANEGSDQIYQYQPGLSGNGSDIQPMKSITVVSTNTTLRAFSVVTYLTYNSNDGQVYGVDAFWNIFRFDPNNSTMNETTTVVFNDELAGVVVLSVSFDINNIMFVSTDKPELIAIDFTSGVNLQTKMIFQSNRTVLSHTTINHLTVTYTDGATIPNAIINLQWSHGFLYGMDRYGRCIVRTTFAYPYFTGANDFIQNPFHAILEPDAYTNIGGFVIEPISGNMVVAYESGYNADLYNYYPTTIAVHQLIGNTYLPFQWSVPCQPQAMKVLTFIDYNRWDSLEQLSFDLTTNRLYWYNTASTLWMYITIELEPPLPQTELGCPDRCTAPPNYPNSSLSCETYSYPVIHGSTCQIANSCPVGWVPSGQFRCAFGNWTGGLNCFQNCSMVIQPFGATLGNCTSSLSGNFGTCQLVLATGYTLSSGSLIQTCYNGSYVNSPPVILKDCPIVTPPNGSLMGNCTTSLSGSFGSCLLALEAGYSLASGSLTITCFNGSYIGSIPTFIKASASSIVARIVGGDRSRPIDQPVTISAAGSYDLDYTGSIASAAISFLWSCQDKTTSLALSSPSSVSLIGSSLIIPPNTMVAGHIYQCQVTVTSTTDSTRSATASVQITATAASLVTAPLVTILDAPAHLPPTSPLQLVATVVSTTNTSINDLLYTWSISSIDPSLVLPNLTQPMNLGTPPNTASLVILANILTPGDYVITVTVKDPFFIDSNTHQPPSGSASVSVTILSSPQPGSCTLTPSTGFTLNTTFTISCSGWHEPLSGDYEPFQYQLQYQDQSHTELGFHTLTSFSLLSTMETILPLGSLSVRVIIQDSMGAYATVDLPAEVTTPPQALFDPFVFIQTVIDGPITSALNSGDPTAALPWIESVSVLLTNVSSNPIYSQEPYVSEIIHLWEELLDEVDRAWSECLLPTLLNLHVPINPACIDIIAQALVPITANAVKFDQPTLHLATNLTSQLIQTAQSYDLTLPSTTSTALGTVISNLMTSCSQLDSILSLVNHLLQLEQLHSVAGEILSLNTTNYVGVVQRNFVSAGVSILLPSRQSVTLSEAAMRGYSAEVNHINSSNIDSIDASQPVEMDTRIVTLAPQWSSCRLSASDSTSLSQIQTIELTLPDGTPINISSLAGPIQFSMPLSSASVNAAIQQAQSQLCDPTLFSANDTAKATFSCAWYDESTHAYSTAGCTTTSATLSTTSGVSSVACECTHLTESVTNNTSVTLFEILYEEATAASTDPCDDTLGSSMYLIFMILYSVIGFVSLCQLMRMTLNFPYMRHWLISIEHTLIGAISFFRALNMAIYWRLYQDMSLSTQILISGLPYVFITWIFTFVIVAWASIWYASNEHIRTSNPFAPYQTRFIIGNSILSITLFLIFVSMSSTHDLDRLSTLNQWGTGLTSVVQLLMSAFFLFYGLLLVRSLTKDGFVSRYAKKLLVVAVSLATSLAISSSFLVYSIADSSSYRQHSILYNSIYFGFDVLALVIVMGLFAKSISDTIKSKNEVSHMKGTSQPSQANSSTAAQRSLIAVSTIDPRLIPSTLDQPSVATKYHLTTPTAHATDPMAVLDQSPSSPSLQAEQRKTPPAAGTTSSSVSLDHPRPVPGGTEVDQPPNSDNTLESSESDDSGESHSTAALSPNQQLPGPNEPIDLNANQLLVDTAFAGHHIPGSTDSS